MTALPSLRQLRYLVAVADHLSFTRAAEASFVSQSALSTALKELETTLGTLLVERDRQSVALTSIGEEVVERARRIVASVDDLADFAADSARPMRRPLRLGVIPTIAPFVLPTLVPMLRKRHPDLRLALREDRTAGLLARLRARQLEFALIALPCDTADLQVRTLFDDPFWLLGPVSDRVLADAAIIVDPAWTDRLLLLEEGHCLREHALHACGAREVASARGFEATSLMTLIQGVVSGLGVALVPELAVRSGLIDAPTLKALPLAPPAPARTVALATRPSSPHLVEFDRIAEAIIEACARA